MKVIAYPCKFKFTLLSFSTHCRGDHYLRLMESVKFSALSETRQRLQANDCRIFLATHCEFVRAF